MMEDTVQHGTAPVADAEDDASPRRVSVAWVADRQTLERFGWALEPLAAGLIDELVDVRILCPSGAGTGVLPSPPIELVHYVWVRWPGVRRQALEILTAELRSRKVELLHALEAGTEGLTARLAKRLGIKYVLSSYAVNDARRLGHLDDRAAAVLASSEPIREALLARRVVPAGRLRLVRPGVHHVPHAMCFRDPDDRIAIVARGALDAFDAFDAVLQAFAELRARNYGCAFFVIGSGRAGRRLHNRADSLGLRGDLTFVDRLPAQQVSEIYRGMDIYISPVGDRCMNMELLLAMAAGVPVLAARNGAEGFLIDGETAQLFARGDAAELTMKLTALLDDRAAARAMAENALQRVHEAHSPADMVAAVLQAYRSAL